MQLPKAEEQVMKYLWKLNKAFMKDLLEEFHEPKPASTTVSTLLKRLSNKGFVGYNTIGNSRKYFPRVQKSEYFASHMNVLIKEFFNSSNTQFVSFFTSKVKFSDDELYELKKIIDNKINKK